MRRAHNLLHRRHLGSGLDSVRHRDRRLGSVLRLLWHSLGLLLIMLIILLHSLSLDCLWSGGLLILWCSLLILWCSLLMLWCSLSLGDRDRHARIDCHGGGGGSGGIRRGGCWLEQRRILFVGTRHREPGDRTTRSFFFDLRTDRLAMSPGMGGQTHAPYGDGGAQGLVLTLPSG